MSKLSLIIILLIGSNNVYAGDLPTPTPRKDRPVADELYLRQIHNEWNNLKIVTTNPDGAIRGQAGDLLIYNNAGSYKFCVLVTAPNVWRCNANALTAP